MPTIILEEALAGLFQDLHASKLFDDGKTIADAVLKDTPTNILAAYAKQKDQKGFDLMAFYNQYFGKAASSESDYQSDTNASVEDHIEKLWEVLTRQAGKNDTYSSLIQLPNRYIVPGGRFNEVYYWDTYFTMLGLQESGKVELMEDILNNFVYLIDTYGFIPNGNRSYFLGRSQPPFFALMVDLLQQTKGASVLTTYLPALEKEYEFWMDGFKDELFIKNNIEKRTVQFTSKRALNRYYDNFKKPRAEMYQDDVEMIAEGGAQAEQMLLDIRGACESGWDFSSRWFEKETEMSTIHTTDICPIDLNCLLYYLEKKLAEGYKEDAIKFKFYKNKMAARIQAINHYCWDGAKDYYFDYDFVKKSNTSAITAAGIYPLFFNIADGFQAAKCAQTIKTHLLKAGGLVTTTVTSGEQWDAPNGWAPLQWMAIEGLRNYRFDTLANEIAERWTQLNIKVFKNTGKLMEKYNVIDTDLPSGGGEYESQEGFGWTNGVLLKLLRQTNKV